MKEKHPIQPIIVTPQGVHRFKANEIVRTLLDNGPFDMNSIASMPFSNEDREQFAQLIGYSVSGAGDLPYMSNDTYETAQRMSHALANGEPQNALQLRVEYLQNLIDTTREALKVVVPELFQIHPDDLRS